MNPLFSLDMINKFNQFRQTFNGNAEQQVKQLMNTGKISQSQYDQAVQQANTLYKLIFGN